MHFTLGVKQASLQTENISISQSCIVDDSD
jgi:hypothetical protein